MRVRVCIYTAQYSIYAYMRAALCVCAQRSPLTEAYISAIALALALNVSAPDRPLANSVRFRVHALQSQRAFLARTSCVPSPAPGWRNEKKKAR